MRKLLFTAALVCAATMWAERSFVDFKIEFRDNPYSVIEPDGGELPSGVAVSGTTYNGGQHGVQGGRIEVSVDGPVMFTIGSCQYSSGTIAVYKGIDVYDEIDNKQACGEQKPNYNQYVTWTYNDTLPATLTFVWAANVYVPYFFAQATEFVPDVVVSYYDTDTTLIANDTVPGATALTYKYGESDVKVAAGKAFRGWFASVDKTAKKVAEGTVLTQNISLYARATDIEVAKSSSVYTYDLTKDYFYPEDHELITITNGQWHDNQHGWSISAGGTINIDVACSALIQLTLCKYGDPATITCTNGNGQKICSDINVPVSKDGDIVDINYQFNATTLTFTANQALYIHAIKVTTKLSGAGVEGNPYRITNVDDWNVFADVDNYEKYWLEDRYTRLDTNIEVTQMAGTKAHPYHGRFDGNGRVMTVNLTNNDDDVQGVAPFHYMDDAHIQNLRVEGTISSNSKYTAGIAGLVSGTNNTIDHCVVAVTINQDDNYAGGIVGNAQSSTITVSNTVFAGIINGISSKRENIGGIVGLGEDGAYILLRNCLENGTYNNIKSMHPIGLIEDYGFLSGNHYLNPQIGTPAHACTLPGYKRVYTDAPETPMSKQFELIDGNTYWVSSAAHVRKNQLYTGEVIPLYYSVVDEDNNTLTEGTDYTIFILDSNRDTVDKANLINEGDYKLAFTAAGACAGSDTLDFTIGTNTITVTSETIVMEDNIYEVKNNVTINHRISILGDVELYLNEGDTLTADDGILLEQGNKLTIYGPGTLNAYGEMIGDVAMPGIGANHFGTLVINGGTINAYGGNYDVNGAAGIGGETNNVKGGSITINGGVVYAEGGARASGIGGGYNLWGGDYDFGVPMDEIIINGGQVTARSRDGKDVMAIGRGQRGKNNGTLTLSWTNMNDSIDAGSIGGFDNIVLLKTFIDSNDVLHTPENPNINGFSGVLKPYDGPTDIDETIVNRKSSNRKFIKDGHLFILRDGKIYTIHGQRVNF